MADRLFEQPAVALYPCDVADANRLLTQWGHRLGPVERPFRQEAYLLEWAGQPLACATSGSIVNGPVAGYQREEVVELTRLGSSVRWANRVMLRLWREVCAPAWNCWPVRAAVSYSHNAMHAGSTYRTDGWEKVTETAGYPGKAPTCRGRKSDYHQAGGFKTLWIWRYDGPNVDPAAKTVRRPPAAVPLLPL